MRGCELGNNDWVTCLVLMLQVQKPGTCGWPLTGCQAAATYTGASCAARSWRTSGTTTTSTSPAGLSVLSVVRRTRAATTCARILNSNTPSQERSTLTISWPARWPCPRRITTPWTRSPKVGARPACAPSSTDRVTPSAALRRTAVCDASARDCEPLELRRLRPDEDVDDGDDGDVLDDEDDDDDGGWPSRWCVTSPTYYTCAHTRSNLAPNEATVAWTSLGTTFSFRRQASLCDILYRGCDVTIARRVTS